MAQMDPTSLIVLNSLDRMLEGLQIVSKEFKYLYLNNKALEHSRQKKEDLIGRTMMERYPGIENTSFFQMLRDCIKNQKPAKVENNFLYPDGTEGWFEISIEPVDVGAIIWTIDITEKKETREKLQQKIFELQNSNTALEQFASIVSHDLKAPLRQVSFFTQTLETELGPKLTEDHKKYMTFVTEGAAHLKELIEDLLEYSTLRTKFVDRTLLDLNDIFNKVVETVKTMKEYSPKIRIESGQLHKINASSSLIRRAIHNLVENAIKFSREIESPLIKVWSTEEEEIWKIYVSDNGIGIDPKDSEKVFKIFQKLHPKTKYEGTGIGLSACKQIAELHRGKIEVQSAEGSGATFIISIPKDPSE